VTAPTTYANHLAMHAARDAVPALVAHGFGTYEVSALSTIASHFAKEQPTCFLSYGTIARECGCSEDRAIKSVRNLVQCGFIEIEGRHRGRTNRYRLVSWEGKPPANSVTLIASRCQRDVNSGLNLPPAAVGPPANSGLYAAASGITSRQQRVEVVPEVVPDEVVQEIEQRSSVAPVCSAPASPSVSVQEDKTDTPQTHAPAPVPSSPERQLTQMYFNQLGKPKAYKKGDHIAAWDARFRKLLTKHSHDDLIGVIEWAFTVSDFWPTRLFRRTGDPVEWFAEHLDQIMSQFIGERAAQKNAQKRAAPVTTPASSIASMFVYE
jgi:hypothetical protein